jgi:hypothetical protein
MSTKYFCDSCGKELEGDFYRQSGSMGMSGRPPVAIDMCKECYRTPDKVKQAFERVTKRTLRVIP